MEPNSIICKRCGFVSSVEKRAHHCPGTRSMHGEMVGTVTIYTPNFPKKASKQILQAGYMKRFGTHPRINVADRQYLADMAEWRMSGETQEVWR